MTLAILLVLMICFLPLFAYGAGKTGIKKRRFTLYVREQAAYTRPTGGGTFATLLVTFNNGTTGTEIGELEDATLKATCKKNEEIPLNDGTKKALDFIGNIEAKHVNITQANITEIAATYDNKDIDVMMHDESNDQCLIVLNFTAHFDEEWLSGGVSSQLFNGEKYVSAKSDFRDFFDVAPTS